MFIKKDLRKIDDIFDDKADSREELKLAKRGSEFNGDVRTLFRENRQTGLANLRILNLYDNSLTILQGICHISYDIGFCHFHTCLMVLSIMVMIRNRNAR